MIGAAYFIGDSLKNFKNPDTKSAMNYYTDYYNKELVHEKHVHYTLGIGKKDAQALVKEHKDIPRVCN